MPSVLATSTLVNHFDVHDLPTAPSRAGRALQGFWRTLTQYITWPRVQMSYRMHPAYAASYRRLETPEQLFARQYPGSYLQGLSGV